MICASLASIAGLIAALRSFSTRRSPRRSPVCRSIETIVPFLIRMRDMLVGPFGCCSCQSFQHYGTAKTALGVCREVLPKAHDLQDPEGNGVELKGPATSGSS